jgi:hypothetical protein
VPKDSEAGKAIFEMLKDGEKHRLLLEVALRGPDGRLTPPGREEMAVVRYFARTGNVYEGGGTSTSPMPAAPEEPPVVAGVIGDDLWAAYHENEARADGIYLNKRLAATCFYHGDKEKNRPHKANDGHWYMAFHRTYIAKEFTNPWFWWGNPHSPIIAVVHFRETEVAKLAGLHPEWGDLGVGRGGSTLEVRGTCRGLRDVAGAVRIDDAVCVDESKGR